MNKILVALMGAGAVFALSTGAHASEPRTHDGFFFQGNLGLGYLSSSASVDAGLGEWDITYSGVGLAGGLQFGGTPVPGLVIGGATANTIAFGPSLEVNGQEGETDGDISLNLSTIGVFGTYYPDPHGGLSLHAMIGYGVLSASDLSSGDESDNNPSGLALTAGAGYDFWIADEWSFGVFGRFTYAPLSYEDVTYSTLAPSLLATITYH